MKTLLGAAAPAVAQDGSLKDFLFGDKRGESQRRAHHAAHECLHRTSSVVGDAPDRCRGVTGKMDSAAGERKLRRAYVGYTVVRGITAPA